MKYSLRYVFDHRFNPNRSQERKNEERLVIINAFGKLISAYPTWFFLNLGFRPDWITFISFGFIVAGAWFFVIGNAVIGATSLLLFLMLDSVDGDMARCCEKKTLYGALLDSFGADIFYSLVPISLGYYIFLSNVSVAFIAPPLFLLIGGLVSISFLFYRLMNSKVLAFFWDKQGKGNKSIFEKEGGSTTKPSFFVRAAKLYRHSLIKGNFFSEPGLVFWIAIFVYFNLSQALAIYLIVILIYNTGYLIPNFVRVYRAFLYYDNKHKNT